jgi:quercetin dioxygenase-like cupin family protein
VLGQDGALDVELADRVARVGIDVRAARGGRGGCRNEQEREQGEAEGCSAKRRHREGERGEARVGIQRLRLKGKLGALVLTVARAGDQIENPLTGERITFVRTAADTGGELLEMESVWTPGGRRTPAHMHPEMEETWEVLAGEARFRIGDEERGARAGDTLVAPAGTPHAAWNATGDEVRVRITMRPALRWEEFVERLFTLARSGRLEPSALVQLMSEFPREIAPPP